MKRLSKKKYIFGGAIILLTLVLVFVFNSTSLNGNQQGVKETGISEKSNLEEKKVEVKPDPAPTVEKEKVPVNVNFEDYSYEFVDENVKQKLNRMIGENGKTAFYLPPTGYINVSQGNKFGIAYALNNPNPSGENYFEINWTVGPSVVESCGVSEAVGQSWIEKNWYTWGKIPQGWIDHMTVYFYFPLNAPECTIKYNFEITKDGKPYDSKQVVLNIV